MSEQISEADDRLVNMFVESSSAGIDSEIAHLADPTMKMLYLSRMAIKIRERTVAVCAEHFPDLDVSQLLVNKLGTGRRS